MPSSHFLTAGLIAAETFDQAQWTAGDLGGHASRENARQHLLAKV